MTNKQQELFRIADELRGTSKQPTLLSILKKGQEQGIIVSFEDIYPFLGRNLYSSGYLLPPDFVIDFIASYLKESRPQTLLDPWANIGSLLIPLNEKLKPNQTSCIHKSPQEYEIVQLLKADSSIKGVVGDPLTLLDTIETRFDSVISILPLATRRQLLTVGSNKGSVNLNDDISHLILLKASMLLEPGGTGLFVTSNKFVWMRNPTTVNTNLAHFDLYIDAILEIPAGSFKPLSLPLSLVIIRNGNPKQLFVGELSANSASTNVLLNNLKTRKEGKAPQLGALVDLKSFSSLRDLVSQRKIEENTKRFGANPVKLVDVTLELNLHSRKINKGFVDKANNIFMPIIGHSAVVTSQSEFHLKAHNYIQIVLDESKVFAPYLANFLNTPDGEEIRKSWNNQGFIPKITKTQLDRAIIYLPHLEEQSQIIKIQSTLTNLTTEIDILQRQLWSHPKKSKEVEKAVKQINHEDSFDTWIETLPFPLASILRIYHGSQNDKDKIDHLFHFFEALSQFTATLMLSAFASDTEFYNKESHAWRDKAVEEEKNRYLLATFGGWTILAERLAKITRTFLSSNDKDKRDTCLSLYGSPTEEFIEMLTSKSLVSVLKTVGGYRNSWKGHGGTVNSKQLSNRLTELEKSLSQTRQIIADHYIDTLLLTPGSNEFSDGIYEYNVTVRMGPNPLFKQIQIKTINPLDKGKLYIRHEEQLRPVKLLSFISFMESPTVGEDTCYFYNRIEDKDARWVSYHFGGESEILTPSKNIIADISLLDPIAKENEQ